MADQNADKQGYNGWTNYETWAVNLWLENEQATSNYWHEAATEIWEDAKADGPFTREEQARISLGDRLKNETEEAAPEMAASLYKDLLNAAMSEVNWDEIAKAMIANVKVS